MQASTNNFEEFSSLVIETRVDASLEFVENVDIIVIKDNMC